MMDPVRGNGVGDLQKLPPMRLLVYFFLARINTITILETLNHYGIV